MKTRLPIKYLHRPPWRSGGESFDGGVLKNGVMVLLEYKGGLLSRTARYSGQASAFTADVDKKFVTMRVAASWRSEKFS
jgi:hypothetical protein